MRIGIDARFYGPIGKGLGRYTSELIAHLERIDAENEYVVFLRKANLDAYEPKAKNFRKELAEFPWYGWREQLLYPSWLRKFRLDLMHFPHFNVPLLYRRPFVVTIHDLILLKHPTTRATTLGPLRFRTKFLLYKVVIGRAIRDARAVLVPSEHTKREIEQRFPAANTKTIVTYEACASPFLENRPAPGADVHAAQAIPAPFVLYVGNAYPHKNLDRLIRAFAAFRERGHGGHRLVLVGAEDYFYARLRRESAAQGLADNVVFFGHASDDELAELYRRAQFYVFPSMHEGFGLPPLEAMCHGLPVASSDATCLPEILGDAARYFDPNDERAITGAMEEVAANETLRRDLAARGKERAKGYDWTRCAERTLDAYRMNEPKGP
jgi:glycosyltransferase involved in cell wall biosynthesis